MPTANRSEAVRNEVGAHPAPSSLRQASTTNPAISAEERERRIAEAAYYYSLGRGGNGDQALDDWLAAEADIDQELVKTEPGEQ